jgi:hypothetical protein
MTGQYERTGIRDLTYSNWHRQFCPERVSMIDVDGLEYCRRCRMPLALIETALDYGQAIKPTSALEQLSLAANVPAFCVLYAKNDEVCDFDRRRRCRRIGCSHGIGSFRVRRIRPCPTSYKPWTAGAFGEFLVNLHDGHEATVCQVVIGGVA